MDDKNMDLGGSRKHGKLTYGRGFYLFIFSNKEDKDKAFRSSPYFFGSKGMFLIPWTLYLDPKIEITIAPIWIKLLPLTIFLWIQSTFKYIGDKLEDHIDKTKPKGEIYSYTKICEYRFEKKKPYKGNVDSSS